MIRSFQILCIVLHKILHIFSEVATTGWMKTEETGRMPTGNKMNINVCVCVCM